MLATQVTQNCQRDGKRNFLWQRHAGKLGIGWSAAVKFPHCLAILATATAASQSTTNRNRIRKKLLYHIPVQWIHYISLTH